LCRVPTYPRRPIPPHCCKLPSPNSKVARDRHSAWVVVRHTACRRLGHAQVGRYLNVWGRFSWEKLSCVETPRAARNCEFPMMSNIEKRCMTIRCHPHVAPRFTASQIFFPLRNQMSGPWADFSRFRVSQHRQISALSWLSESARCRVCCCLIATRKIFFLSCFFFPL
jgi:hypothetical protein